MMTSETATISVIAPARVDLSAGFPDVSPFCSDQPGYVVNLALGLSVRVDPNRTPIDVVAVGDAALPQRLAAIVARSLGLRGGFEISAVTHGFTPGSGLGSSGALSVAVAYAMLEWAGKRTSALKAEEVVELSVQAERTVGVTGGTQDQWASAHGGLGIVRQHGERGKRIPISSSQEFLSYLMLVHPGGTRDSSAIVEAVIAQSKLRRSRSVIAAMNSAALQLEAAIGLNDVSSAFDLMNESRNLLLQLNERIVSITIQELIEAAPGVLGSKPCGAGGESAAWIVAVEPDARRSFSDFIRSRGPLVSIAEASPSGVRKIAHGRT